MFVRVKTTPNSPRKSIQVVENIRTGTKTKQKILHYVGIAMDEDMEKKLIELAEEVIQKLHKERQTQNELFDDIEPKRGRPSKKGLKDILPPDEVALTDVIEEKRIIDGVNEIGGEAYDALGYNNILPTGAKQLLRDLVLARLAYPCSKHKLWQILFEQFGKQYDLNKFYRLMDQLHPQIDKIKQITCAKTQSLMPSADVVLFDVTTLHFESIEADGLREFGYSKNCRFNTTQVVLALATNELGLPLGYELFEGNMAEVKTLLLSLDKWKKLFNIKSVCFVADRAMFSKENLNLLDASGYDYVVAAKLRSLSNEMQAQILDGNNYRLSQVADDVMWTTCFNYKADLLAKFELDKLSFTYDEKQQLRDIYTILAKHDEVFAVEFKDNLLVKLRSKSFTLSQEFKDKLLANKIFISGSNSNRLIVSYRSTRAKHDQHKRELILKKLKTKTGNVEKVINSGAKRYLSVNSIDYHFINSVFELKKFLESLESANLPPMGFIVYASESEIKVFINKSAGLKHLVIISSKLFNEVRILVPTLNLIHNEELSQSIGINQELINGSISVKEVKTALKKAFKEYLPEVSTYVDEIKIRDDAIWDGMHGIITNIKDKQPHELIGKYCNLWRIEEAFRINKHNLKMRPIYHWNRKRIESHIALCYMSFAVLKRIQYQVELTQIRYSPQDVMEVMLSVQASIYVHKKTGDRYRMPGAMSNNARYLYKAFGLTRSIDAAVYLP